MVKEINKFNVNLNNEIKRHQIINMDSDSSENDGEFLDISNEFKCPLCMFSAKTYTLYNRHCMGVKHHEAISKATKQEILDLPPRLTQKTYICDRCNYYTLYKADFLCHCKSRNHSHSLGSRKIKVNQESKYSCCVIKCDFHTTDRDIFEKHLVTNFHFSNIPQGTCIQRERLADDDRVFYCKPCDFSSILCAQYEKHIISSKHIKKVKKLQNN